MDFIVREDASESRKQLRLLGSMILGGDAQDILAQLPDKSVQCIVTSPPYWGLRDYGIEGQIGLEEPPKGKKSGYTECWTIVNVDNIDLASARTESPSTNRFYRLSQIEKTGSSEYADFRSRVLGLAGITAAKTQKRGR